MNDTGYHYIIDLKVSDSGLLASPSRLEAIFTNALRDFTILQYNFHKFDSEGEGVTGFFLLSESHCSYHTYPENNYIAIDVFTCGRAPDDIVNVLSKFMNATDCSSHFIERGTISIEARKLAFNSSIHFKENEINE